MKDMFDDCDDMTNRREEVENPEHGKSIDP